MPSFRGKVYAVLPELQFGNQGFRKRDVVLVDDSGRYSSYVPFTCVRDTCDLLANVKADDEVEVEYRLTGREWRRDAASEPKYFLSAEVVEITNITASQEKVPRSAGGGAQAPGSVAEEDDDEVPF